MKKFKPPRLKDITLLLVGVLCIASPISAVMARKNIEVLTGVEIFVDGIQVHPVDANGNRVETFIYQGTTYIPARAVSEYLGYAVNWDGQNQRVYIGEMPGEKQLTFLFFLEES